MPTHKQYNKRRIANFKLNQILNLESESTLGQASAKSIADTKLIEKPQGSDAPRSSDQKTVSDPIEKRTSDENECVECGDPVDPEYDDCCGYECWYDRYANQHL